VGLFCSCSISGIALTEIAWILAGRKQKSSLMECGIIFVRIFENRFQSSLYYLGGSLKTDVAKQ
jgi:hypothetical protein